MKNKGIKASAARFVSSAAAAALFFCASAECGADIREMYKITYDMYDSAEIMADESAESGNNNTGSCGENLVWELSEDGTLVVSGSGLMTSGWKNDRRIRNVIIGEGVLSIAESAFSGCERLKSISISETVRIVGSRAFYGCAGLTEITVPDRTDVMGYETFYGCSSLEKIKLPAGITVIPDGMFYGCKKLSETDIPESVIDIGENAFAGCRELKSLFIPAGVGRISDTAFSGCTGMTGITVSDENSVYSSDDGILFNKDGTELIKYPAGSGRRAFTVPQGVLRIGAGAFEGSALLEGIVFSNVESIGNKAFRDCGLISVSIPGSVSDIGMYAFSGCRELVSAEFTPPGGRIADGMFYGCASLKKAVIPRETECIGTAAFSGCTGLREAVMSEGLKEIGPEAFWDCSAIEELNIPSSADNIAESAFFGCTGLKGIYVGGSNKNYTDKDGVLFSKDMSVLEKYPAARGGTEYIIPKEIKKIGSRAFEGCGNLENIIFEKKAAYISVSDEAFMGCTALKYIDLPVGTEEIGEAAFMGCSTLKEAVLWEGLKSIGNSAFDSCLSMQYIDIPSSTVSIGSAVFYNCPMLYEINVSEKNKKYMSEDGILFNKSQTELIQYPADKWEEEYTIPEKVTDIAWYAFYGCNELEEVNIGKKVGNIGYLAFYGCAELGFINVDPENPYYSSEDGVLFDKDMTELIQYPPAWDEEVYTVPSGVKYIDGGAFYRAEYLEEIILPDGLEFIGRGAFRKCRNLSGLVIPKETEEIGERAFDCCDRLTDIYYGGTMSEWKEIKLIADAGNITVHCADGVIEAVFKEVTPAGDGEQQADGIIVRRKGRETEVILENAQSYPETPRVYIAVYDKDGIFLKAYVPEASRKDGRIVYSENIDLSGDVKVMIWYGDMRPVAAASRL